MNHRACPSGPLAFAAVFAAVALLPIAATPASAQPVTVQLRNTSGAVAESFQEFEPMTLRVTDTGLVGAGSIEVLVQSQLRGDEEWVVLPETPASSGIFTALLPTAATLDPAPPAHSDGTLEVTEIAGPPLQRDSVSLIFYSCTWVICPIAQASMSGNRVQIVDAQSGYDLTVARLPFSFAVMATDFSAASQPQIAVAVGGNGDSEILTLNAVSGAARFAGSISVYKGTPVPGDGQIQAAPGAILTVSLPDPLGLSAATDSLAIPEDIVYFVDSAGREIRHLLLKAPVRVRYEAPAANLDELAVETFSVSLKSMDGVSQLHDSETLALTETGADTGIFEGEMPNQLVTGSFNPGDGLLQTLDDDFVRVVAGPANSESALRPGRVRFVDAGATEIPSITPGTVYLEVESYLGSLDPNAAEQVAVDVNAPGYELETFLLTEQGIDSTFFRGTFTAILRSPVPGNSLLEAASGNYVTAFYGPIGTSDIDQLQIFADPDNQAPAAVDDSSSTPEDQTLLIDLLANDSDPDGDSLILRSFTQGAHGSVVAVAGQPGRLRYTPVAGYFGSDGFTYTVQDPSGATASATVSLSVTSVDDPPVAANDSAIGNEDSYIYIRVLLNDSDPEGQAITLVRFDATSAHGGTITTSTAPNDFRYLSKANWNGTDTFTYEIEAGGQRATATVTVTVRPMADPPVAVADSVTTLEEVPVTINVMANDSDPDGQAISIFAVYPNGNNVVTNPNGTLTFTPALNFFGTKSFSYQIKDPGGTFSSSATVTVTVTNVDDPPSAQNDTLTAAEDVLTTLNVRANDSDPDGGVLTVQSVTQAVHGTVTLVSGAVRYLSHLNYNGPDAFTYTVVDSAGVTATATVNLTVTPSNDPPVAVADSATTAEDTSVVIDVLANDTDVDGDLPLLGSWSYPAGVNVTSVTVDGRPRLLYTPKLNFHGVTTFSYTARDSAYASSAPTTVTVTVTPVNDPPNAVNDAATTAEDTAVTINVLANDSDVEGNPLSVIGASLGGGATGTVTVNANQTLTYGPGLNYYANTGFITYQVSDGSATSTATVTLNVTPVNDPPIPVPDAAITPEDQAVAVYPLANDADDSSGSMSIVLIFGLLNGSATHDALTGETLFTPAANFHGVGGFSYRVQDSTGLTSNGTVTVTVTPVNDDPVAAADAATVAEDATITVAVLANDSDADGDTLSLSAAGGASHGSVTFTASGVTYTPAADYNGPDSFSYTVRDASGATATATVTITVTAVNDIPVAVADTATVAEDLSVVVPVLANDSDIDGDSLTVTAAGQPAHGSVSLAGGVLTYTPAADYSGADTFSYTIEDGAGGSATATVGITVIGENDPPIAVADSGATAEDTPLAFAPLGNDSDADGDSLSIEGIVSVTGGNAGATAGTITFTPAANWSGTAYVHFTVGDGHGGSAAGIATIAVSAVNDDPVAVADAATVAEDGSTAIAVLANDVDVDGDPVAVTGASGAAHGTVGFSGSAVTYTPASDYHGPDAFTYTIADGQGGSSSATVTIAVEPVNDPPTAANDSAVTTAGSSVVVAVLANDSDPEGAPLAVSAVGAPLNGSAVASAGGTVTYTPAAGYSGADSFTYTVSDGGASATATVSVTVNNALGRVAVLGLRSVQVETGADVLSGDVVVNAAEPPPYLGVTELVFGTGTTVAAGWDVRANAVTISAGATIAADITSNGLTNSGTLLGAATSPLAVPVFATLPALETATPGTTDVNVGTNGAITLAPGVYRDLLVAKKGVVTFTGGVYVFRSVVIQREASLLFAAPSTVKVQGRMSTATMTKIQPATVSTATAATIVFHIAGINGTNGALASTPKAVEIATDNVLKANFNAPNGTLWIQARTAATGALVGRHVRVGPDVQVSLNSAW